MAQIESPVSPEEVARMQDPSGPQHSRMEHLIEQAASERRIVNDDNREQRATRYTLLRIHAWMMILIGFTMLMTGTAQVFETEIGIWTRPALGGLALMAGAVLMVGVDAWRLGNRRHLVEVIGLSLVALWDLAMAGSFAWGTYLYGSIEFRMPWDLDVIDPLQPRPYGPLLYLGLGCMVAIVHIPACWRDLRNRRW